MENKYLTAIKVLSGGLVATQELLTSSCTIDLF